MAMASTMVSCSPDVEVIGTTNKYATYYVFAFRLQLYSASEA